jgi:hypothetical protein
MALNFSDDTITGDHTGHTARRVPDDHLAWEVSWLPGRQLERSGAITAMAIADMAAANDPRPGDRLWPHITTWATVIGLTTPEALDLVSQPPGSISDEHDDAMRPDPEAAG